MNTDAAFNMATLVDSYSQTLRILAILVSAILSLICFEGLALAQESYYRLLTDRLICVRDNLDQYLDLPGDDFLISVESCPDILENPLLSRLVNEGPNIPFLPDEAPDTLIAVTRDQLECLAGKTIDAGQPLYRYYPQDCRLEPEE